MHTHTHLQMFTKFLLLTKMGVAKCMFVGQITTLCLVPPLMVFLAKHPLVVKYDLRSVREIYCGAAPLSVDLIPQVLARLPTACVRQGYGMTELSVVITVMPPLNNSLSGSVGKLAPGLQAKVSLTMGLSLFVNVIDKQCTHSWFNGGLNPGYLVLI